MELQKAGTLYPNNIDRNLIDRVESIINTGRAVLFTGAGFSVGCENILKKSPPTAKELARLISNRGGLEEDDDLSFVSDYFLSNKNRYELLYLLKENFTVVNSKEYHKKISLLRWKRIYTTNYDNSIEHSAKNSGKIIYSLTTEDSPKEFYKKKDCCIHINGTISSVSEKDLDSKFKLTRTSYASPDSFVNSPWYYYFKKDLEQCSAIVFIGYSLYDIDIEKILFSSSPILKEKTYFIISKQPSQKERYLLSKYGHVLPIGTDGFAKSINNSELLSKDSNFWLDAFAQYNIMDSDDTINDDQILDFILHGNLKEEYINHAMSADQKKPFLIIRRCIDEAKKILENNRYLAILGDFGNGKTVALKELTAYFTIVGQQVFFLQNSDGDYVQDIEKIDSLAKNSILTIDDYSLYLDILIYISKFNSEKIKVIFSERSSNHEHLRRKITDEGIRYAEINIDVLQQEEMENFVAIIDNLGYWGEKRANLLLKRKVELISQNDRGQISHTLLSIFNSPQIKKRINLILSPLLSDREHKDTVFSICLLEIVNLPRNLSLISEVAGNDFIYNSILRNNKNFNQIFFLKDNKVISKSAVFSVSLVQNFFSSSYITNKLLDLAEKFNSLQKNGTVEKELFISLLRFSFIERLLPKKVS